MKRKETESSESDRHRSSKTKAHKKHKKYKKHKKSKRSSVSILGIVEQLENSASTHVVEPGLSNDLKTKTVIERKDTVVERRERRSMVPQSKAEYERAQSIIREVYDPLSGRTRLIRGSGEIVERIVSRAEQININRVATVTDGAQFQIGMNKQ